MRAGGVDALMNEFSLDSSEGVALMCLAEALLRVPDDAGRMRLIRDKLRDRDWSGHVGHSPSLFVNAAAWSLALTGRLLAPEDAARVPGALARIAARGGERLIGEAMECAMRRVGQQFVLGETIEEALERVAGEPAADYRYSFDMLGEAARVRRTPSAMPPPTPTPSARSALATPGAAYTRATASPSSCRRCIRATTGPSAGA